MKEREEERGKDSGKVGVELKFIVRHRKKKKEKGKKEEKKGGGQGRKRRERIATFTLSPRFWTCH